MPWTTPGTATAGDVLTAAFWNTQVRDNLNELAPLMTAFTSYTPAVEQNGARTSTVTNARYVQIGKLVRVWASLTITQAGSSGSAIICSIPVALKSTLTTGDHVVGSFYYGQAAGTRYVGSAIISPAFSTSSKVIFITNAVNNVLGINPAFATANNDTLQFFAEYEAS